MVGAGFSLAHLMMYVDMDLFCRLAKAWPPEGKMRRPVDTASRTLNRVPRRMAGMPRARHFQPFANNDTAIVHLLWLGSRRGCFLCRPARVSLLINCLSDGPAW